MSGITHKEVGNILTEAEYDAVDAHTVADGTFVRTATLVVAASDSSAKSKAQADYVCDGIADNVEIQAAIDAITDVGEIAVLGANLYFSDQATIDLVTKKISIRAGNTKVISSCASGVPAFEIKNQPAYKRFQPVLSGFIIDGQDKAVGRVGVKLTDNIYMPPLEFLEILNTNKGIEVSSPVASQAEGLTLEHIWLRANNYSIYYPDFVSDFSCSTPFWNDININLATGGVGVRIGTNVGLPNGFMKLQIWLESETGTAIFLDGNLNGTHLILKIDATAPTTSTVFDIGANAYQPQWAIQADIAGDYMPNFLNNPYSRDIRIIQPRRLSDAPVLSLPSLAGAEILLSSKEPGIGSYLTDISGHYRSAVLTGAPTWGTQAQLGKLTFDGTTQYGNTPTGKVRCDGDRTWIVVCSPNFLESENAVRTIFKTGASITSYMSMSKRDNASNNVMWFMVSDGTNSINAGAALGFAQNDILVLVGTFHVSTGVGKLYHQGRLVNSATNANISMPVTATELFFGRHTGASEYWKGDIMLAAQLPRLLDDVEVGKLSATLLKLGGGGKTENSGTATITGAVNTVNVTHGLAATPTRVFVTALQTGQGDYAVTTKGATTFTITFVTQPGASTWTFDWRAQVGEG